jgi:hypothetical protein
LIDNIYFKNFFKDEYDENGELIEDTNNNSQNKELLAAKPELDVVNVAEYELKVFYFL